MILWLADVTTMTARSLARVCTVACNAVCRGVRPSPWKIRGSWNANLVSLIGSQGTHVLGLILGMPLTPTLSRVHSRTKRDSSIYYLCARVQVSSNMDCTRGSVVLPRSYTAISDFERWCCMYRINGAKKEVHIYSPDRQMTPRNDTG